MKILVCGASGAIGSIVAKHLCKSHEVVGTYCYNPTSDLPCEMAWFDCTSAHILPVASADAVIWCIGVQGQISSGSFINDAEEIIGCNLTAPISYFPDLVDRMSNSRRPKAIFFSGGGATKARLGCSAYAASKAGLVRFVETVGEEWKQFGIPADINCVAPGIFDSRMTRKILASGNGLVGREEYDKVKAALEASPEQVAQKEKNLTDLIDYLISEKSDGVSGKLISAQWDTWWKQ